MEKTGAVVVAAVLGLALEGCGEYPLKESQIEAAMPERIAPIVVGETDRAVVRRLLGTPLAASDHWQFDLIHVTDKNSDLIWIFVPVPGSQWLRVGDVRRAWRGGRLHAWICS
jgi:hypothetical protein